MAAEPPPPEDDDPPGVPEWVVTYGDMMSLLLTFFIMLVSLSEIKEDQRYKDVLASLHDRMGYASAAAAPPGAEQAGNADVPGLKAAGRPPADAAGGGGTPRPTAPGPRALLTRDRGGRPVSAGPAVAFEPGTDEFAAGAAAVLDAVAAGLAGKPQKVEVRGFAADGGSLAHRRARRVMDEVVARGVREGRFRLRTGGGETGTGDASPPADRAEVWVLDVLATDPRPGG